MIAGDYFTVDTVFRKRIYALFFIQPAISGVLLHRRRSKVRAVTGTPAIPRS
jgi:hypothetical protein